MTQEFQIAEIGVIIVDHQNPVEREERNVLRYVAWIARQGEPLRGDGAVKLEQSLTPEASVAGDGVGDQRLNPGVADVLELFIIGAVLVMFMRTAAGGVPGNFEEFFQLRNSMLTERGSADERIMKIFGREFKDARFVQIEKKFDIAPRTVPERVERFVPVRGEFAEVRIT